MIFAFVTSIRAANIMPQAYHTAKLYIIRRQANIIVAQSATQILI
jgi:hypothetical protein